MLYLGLGILLLVVGLIFEIMAFTEPSWTLASRIFAVICGLIFLALPLAGLGGVIEAFRESKKSKKASENTEIQPEISEKKAEVLPEKSKELEEALQEKSEAETEDNRFLSRFRDAYSDFFKAAGLPENSALQYNATQLYWHILAMQKKRLDRKNIALQFSSERKASAGIPAVKNTTYFDGQYQISELSESLELCIKYVRNGSDLLCRKLSRLAHVVTTGAKPVGKKNIICPNCGNTTTRENLIDGCDYCGTKFRVQDLENKVSAFRLCDDYEAEYEKYRIARSQYNMKVFWGQFAVYFVLMCLVYMTDFRSVVESAGNIALAILFIPLTAAIGSGMFAFLGLCIFWVTIFPAIQAKESVQFYSKKRLDRMKKRYSADTKAEQKIREFDPNFSVAAFYSNLSNKLACIHFADTKAASEAFFETDRNELQEKYADVVDMDIEDINVSDFMVEYGLQKLRVDVLLNNLMDNNSKLIYKKEKLRLTLIKSADCKTETICGPAVFTCKGCGTSLALEKGKRCEYCGKELDLKKYDWVIRDYEFN